MSRHFPPAQTRAWRHVVVIGAGFAGLQATRLLARHPDIRVTLIDRQNHHLFLPLLYQVAIAGMGAPAIARPVREILHHHRRARSVMGEVTHIDRAAKKVRVDHGWIPYDDLIVASGSTTAHLNIPGQVENARYLKTLDEAMDIRDQILSACEEATRTSNPERRRMLTRFNIVGGGATGVELAASLGEFRVRLISADYPELNPEDFQVTLIHGGDRLLQMMSEKSSAYALQSLQAVGVDVVLNTHVTKVKPTGVKTDSGQFFDGFTTIWTAGVTGNYISGLPEPEHGNRVMTTDELHLPDDPNVYIVGDLNGLTDPETGYPYPQIAATAIQQATLAAKNIVADLAGKEQHAYVFKDPGAVVPLSRNRGVFERGRIGSRGFLAWFVYYLYHLYTLSGFRTRLYVFLTWAYHYVTYENTARVLYHRRTFPDELRPEQTTSSD